MNCVYIWDFLVISTILSTLDEYLSIHKPLMLYFLMPVHIKSSQTQNMIQGAGFCV